MRKLRKTTKQYIMVALICTTVITGASIILSMNFYYRTKNTFNKKYDEMESTLVSNTKDVYIVTEDIGIGDYITVDNVNLESVITSQPEDTYMTEKEIGTRAIISLPIGTQVLSSMLSEEGNASSYREVVYEGIKINPNIVTNDAVDIRILYPNGENYIVLSKKNIKLYDETLEESYYILEEEEILRMSSAIVDCYLYEGTVLYTTKYIESSIQEEAVITYYPSIEVTELIKSSPNILQIAMKSLSEGNRLDLEKRQYQFSEEKDNNNYSISSSTSEVYVDSQGFAYYDEKVSQEEEEYQLGE